MTDNARLDELREDIANLEHEQWAHWTKHFLENNTATNRVRWKYQIKKPYSELSDKEKESDREWADKVIALIKKKLQEKPTESEVDDGS